MAKFVGRQRELEAETVTCPQGHTVTGRGRSLNGARPTRLFTFPRATCEACPLFERCVRSKKTRRTAQTGPYGAELQAARLRQQTDEFDALYRLRPAVERKIGELVGHGVRNTPYVAEPKRKLQRLWTGAALNLKRLFRLADAQDVDLHVFLDRQESRQAGWAAA